MTPAGGGGATGVRPVHLVRRLAVLGVALAAGCLIAALDRSPGNDATGVTAGLLVIAAFVLAAVDPRSAPLTWLLVGLPVPLAAFVAKSPDWPSILLAIVFAGAGALVGWSLGRLRSAR
jgi:hypothetical protein